MKRIFVILFIIHIILSICFMKNELESDGYLEIGFPKVVYKTTNSKQIAVSENGFFVSHFLINIFIILFLSFLFS